MVVHLKPGSIAAEADRHDPTGVVRLDAPETCGKGAIGVA
jgi:hypothetical protein